MFNYNINSKNTMIRIFLFNSHIIFKVTQYIVYIYSIYLYIYKLTSLKMIFISCGWCRRWGKSTKKLKKRPFKKQYNTSRPSNGRKSWNDSACLTAQPKQTELNKRKARCPRSTRALSCLHSFVFTSMLANSASIRRCTLRDSITIPIPYIRAVWFINR